MGQQNQEQKPLMFSGSKNMGKALNVAFDYLMSLDDKKFYEELDEHANGDIAKALRELGAAEYEWDLYLKKRAGISSLINEIGKGGIRK